MATDNAVASGDNARHGALETLALCIANALASCGAGAQSIWVAAFVKSGMLTTVQVGWLASGALAAIALSTLAVSAWGRRLSPRRIAVGAAVLVVLANVLAMQPAVPALVVGCLSAGVAMGALLATVTSAAARRPDAQRVLALMQAASLLMISLAFLLSPALTERWGAGGFFALLAGVGVIAAVVLCTLPQRAGALTQTRRLAVSSKLAPLLACLGLTGGAVGLTTVGTYLLVIGNSLGFSTQTLGAWLAVVTPCAVLGPIAAHRLGERIGLLKPIAVGMAVGAISFFFLVNAASPLVYCLYVTVAAAALTFYQPYALTLISRLETSERFVGAAPAFIMAGAAVGPALGGKLIGAASLQVLVMAAGACIALGILLFFAAAALGKSRMHLSADSRAVTERL